MSEERCMELLNAVIDHVSCCNNTKETIHELLLIGFTAQELETEFGFDGDDIRDAASEMEE